MRRGPTVALALVAVLVFGAAAVVYLVGRSSSGGSACRVVVGTDRYRLDREQAANATTIAAAADALGMPHHAVTIGTAAALQESQLHNLTHGDRDSLGVFQQRPSQGWGSPAEILNPRFAAESFLRALARVDQWQNLPVGDAAQRVQRSATPTAYAKWETEARTIARATTGEVPGALTCTT